MRNLPLRVLALACLATLSFYGCTRSTVVASNPAPAPATAVPEQQTLIRATGIIQALRVYSIQTPQISGQNGRMTLVKLVKNGAEVKKGDPLAEFDRTAQKDTLRDAESKFDDLSHQWDQKRAQYKSDAAKRMQTLREAEADLAKAELNLRKAELLSEIDRLKNQTSAESARTRVASLKKSNALHDEGEKAALRILELQRDRQKVSVERTRLNMDRMLVRAPIAGMVALETTWRNGSMGPAQEGDQMWQGQNLVRIFDPGQMVVQTSVAEPDGASLQPGVKARIRIDAYPTAQFDGVFEMASPVATSALDSPIKTFNAIFRITQLDPRLMPDLSASVEVERP
jgi:multidrug resistance efflux pump